VIPYLLKADPNTKKYVTEDGKLMVKLKEALYGTIQAAKLWYEN
jgi:hypothetical protein